MPLSTPITSRSNARVKALRAAFSGAAKRPGELVGVEGELLIGEALRSGLVLESLFVRVGSEGVLERLAVAPAEVSVLSVDVFDSAVETNAPQGIAAMLAIPEVAVPEVPGTVLLLEGLQDPGNMGTLLRSAEAFGVSAVMVTPDTVSAWNPKVMRASAGSVFRVPVVRVGLAEMQKRLRGITVFAAVAAGAGAVSVLEAEMRQPCAVLVGNEGAGLSAAALAMGDVRVTIPCSVESLNAAVAGSVLLYEVMRQRGATR